MGTFTSILNLFKPATTDFVDVVADLNDNIDKIEAALGPMTTAWTAYTPTVTGVTTSALTGRYKQFGKTVFAHVSFTLSAAPTAEVQVTLPVAAKGITPSGNQTWVIGRIGALRQGSQFRYAEVWPFDSTHVKFIENAGGGASWAGGVPVAWANTDIWEFQVMYEAI